MLSVGIGGHQRTKGRTNEWLTPPAILKAIGSFDLDPCSPIDRPWPTAANHYTIEDDGLNQEWRGRIWMNPPYSSEIRAWMAKMARHDNGITLVFARTDTSWFHKYAFAHASAMLFIRSRVRFHTVDGAAGKYTGGAPSVLVAYGESNAECLQTCGIDGAFVQLRKPS